MQKEIVPDLLNEEPTVAFGLTQAEFGSIVSKSVGIPMIVLVTLGVLSGKPAMIPLFAGLGVLTGAIFTYCIAKFYISPKKSGKPFGYLAKHTKLNSIWFKLGITKVPTIHRTGVWRHYK